MVEPRYPSREWFWKWRETLLLGNIKSSIQHTYNKAMSYRNQKIEHDASMANQIVNIDEDAVSSQAQAQAQASHLGSLRPPFLTNFYNV